MSITHTHTHFFKLKKKLLELLAEGIMRKEKNEFFSFSYWRKPLVVMHCRTESIEMTDLAPFLIALLFEANFIPQGYQLHKNNTEQWPGKKCPGP